MIKKSIVLIILSVASIGFGALTDGLVFRATFDDSFDNTIGNLHVPVQTGTPSISIESVFGGGSLRLNGTSCLTFDDSSTGGDLHLRDRDWTMSAWIKLDSVGGSGQRFYMFLHDTGQFQWYYMMHATWKKYIVLFTNTKNPEVYMERPTLAANQWIHIAVTMDRIAGTNGGASKIYVNGVLAGTYTAEKSETIFGGNTIKIGDSVNRIPGNIDDFGIWHRALSDAEILEVMNSGVPNIIPTTSDTLYLYDDFSNPSGWSAGVWDVEVGGNGAVTFENGQCIIDGTNFTGPKYQRIIAEFAKARFVSVNPAELFRTTWDMQILSDDVNGWSNGLYLGKRTDLNYGTRVGQLGGCDGSADYKNKLTSDLGKSDIAFPTLKYHYDVTFTNLGHIATETDPNAENNYVDVAVEVYSYNSIYDTNPEGYKNNETPIWTISGTDKATDINDMASIIFAVNNHVGTDTTGYAQRSKISIDNVYTTVEVSPGVLCGTDIQPYPQGDIDLDCKVDLNDFAILSDNWLAGN